MAILVIGLIMVMPGLVVCAIGLINLFEYVDDWTRWTDQLEHYDNLFIAQQVIMIVDSLGATVMGLLLVLLSWKPAVLSVRALLYPALVIGGVYLVFTWFIDIALSVAYGTYFGWHLGVAQLLIRPAYMLPALVGGIVLIRVGMRRPPNSQQGTQVVRSHPGSWP